MFKILIYNFKMWQVLVWKIGGNLCYLKKGNELIRKFEIIYPYYRVREYPPGSKCEALRLGVHLILIFYEHLTSDPEDDFFFGGGRWGVSNFFGLQFSWK